MAVVRWVLEKAVPVKPASAQLVYINLAWRARSDDGTGAYPSLKRIARDTGLGGKTVRTSLELLERAGRIERQGTHRNGITKVWAIEMAPMFEVAESATSHPQRLTRDVADSAASMWPNRPDDVAESATEHTGNSLSELGGSSPVVAGRAGARDAGARAREGDESGVEPENDLIERICLAATRTPRYAKLTVDDLDDIELAVDELADIDGSHDRAVSELEHWLDGHGALLASGPPLGDLVSVVLKRHAAAAAGQLEIEPPAPGPASIDDINRWAEDVGYRLRSADAAA